MRTLLVATVSSLLALPAFSQTVHVVSASGGPFHDIEPAIAAAQPGDIVLVRAGTYSSFVLDKPLRVLADPGATVSSILLGFRVSDIGAGEIAEVRGLSVDGVASMVQVSANQGLVHLEGLSVNSGVTVTDSRQVMVLGCALAGSNGLQVFDSTVAVAECQLTAVPSLASLPGLEVVRSRVTFAQGQILGGVGIRFNFPGPAVTVDGGTLVLGGDAATTVTTRPGNSAAPAIQLSGNSDLRLDPKVVLTPTGGAPAVAGDGTVVVRPIPTATGSVGMRTLLAGLRAPGAVQGILVASPPFGPPLSLPFGELWVGIDHIVLHAGAIGATGRLSTAVGLPVLPPGTLAATQWVVVQASGFELSTPLVLSLDG